MEEQNLMDEEQNVIPFLISAFCRKILSRKFFHFLSMMTLNGPLFCLFCSASSVISVCILSPHVHFTPRSFHPTFISSHVHFTPRSFHPTFISPHVHFTPRSFHPTFISPHVHFTPRSFHPTFISPHI